MDSRELRTAFLDFFASKGHQIVESSSLVPNNDPTLLFTNAGMVQFKEALALREDRGYKRAASCQRCVRAGGKHNDLDNVGYTTRHHTFFEMLGNFSFGDYFKEEAIAYAWEFLTEVIGLPPDRLWVTVHKDDDEAERIWREGIGFDPDRITRLGDDDNFWTMGDTGPCGPSSEIFYDHGAEIPGGPPGSPDGELDRYVEIWNLVFTQYERAADGTLTPLPKPCVDTGMGLERVAVILQDVHNNYDIDLFLSLRSRAAELLACSDLNEPSLKVIADHIRTATFLIADGVLPSNGGRGYVLRRIIRRALRHGHKLQPTAPYFHRLADTVVEQFGDVYPLLLGTQDQTRKILLKEEQQFETTLDQGMHMLEEAISNLEGSEIPGEVVFKLYDTYGFPIDLTEDIARERVLTLDMPGFEREMQVQKERARAASKFSADQLSGLNLDFQTVFTGYTDLTSDGSKVLALFAGESPRDSCVEGEECMLVVDRTPFYAESGGQAGDTGRFHGNGVTLEVDDTVKDGDAIVHRARVLEGTVSVGDSLSAEVDAGLRGATRLNHSATHLLHAALRETLGDHVNQRGSLVEPDRLRFDFSHFEEVSTEELRLIERRVNEQIRRNSEIQTEVMALDQARAKGAMALFDEKYSSEVRVITMGDGYSVELCGGTHAGRTGDLGGFQIIKQQGIASGVRRIEATTGEHASDRVEGLQDTLVEVTSLLRTDPSNVVSKLKQLVDENKKLEKLVTQLNAKLVSGASNDMSDTSFDLDVGTLIVNRLDGADPKSLPDALDRLKNKVGTGVVVLACVNDRKIDLIAGVTKDLTDRVKSGDLVNFVANQVGGKGGGRPDMARAGGSDVEGLPAALESVSAYVQERLA